MNLTTVLLLFLSVHLSLFVLLLKFTFHIQRINIHFKMQNTTDKPKALNRDSIYNIDELFPKKRVSGIHLNLLLKL